MLKNFQTTLAAGPIMSRVCQDQTGSSCAVCPSGCLPLPLHTYTWTDVSYGVRVRENVHNVSVCAS